MKNLAFSKPPRQRSRKILLWAARCARTNAERASAPPVRADLSSWADSFEEVLNEDAAAKKSHTERLTELVAKELAKHYERNLPKPQMRGASGVELRVW